jgi:dienelactone hydrolase
VAWVRCCVALVGAGLVGLVGCSTGGGASPSGVVTVTPQNGLWDAPIVMRVSGLAPGARAMIELQVTDGGGTRWSSRAVFDVGARGGIDPSRQAPVSGAYRGVDSTGLVATLKPQPDRGTYYFPRPGDRGESFRVLVSESGRVVAAASATRTLVGPNVVMRRLTVRSQGVVGRFFAPKGASRRVAVLVFGGSEGGLAIPSQQAGLLASHGVAALALAYFAAPGLPHHLKRIPLEYFARALRWLDHQPSVDPHRVAVLSGSRGSEAALLLGAIYPSLVHGVIATSPSALIYGAATRPPRVAAWTLDRAPLPFARIWNDLSPRGIDARSIIPVERIHGPILTASGERDGVWDASAFAAMIQRRLTLHRDPWPHHNLDYPTAGHFIDIAIPSTSAAVSTEDAGGDPISDDHARTQLWHAILTFLGTLKPQRGQKRQPGTASAPRRVVRWRAAPARRHRSPSEGNGSGSPAQASEVLVFEAWNGIPDTIPTATPIQPQRRNHPASGGQVPRDGGWLVAHALRM